ncbi:hypothetical protein Tco_1566949, partial [Tanacetum coccineum]
DLWDDPPPPVNVSSILEIIIPTLEGRLRKACNQISYLATPMQLESSRNPYLICDICGGTHEVDECDQNRLPEQVYLSRGDIYEDPSLLRKGKTPTPKSDEPTFSITTKFGTTTNDPPYPTPTSSPTEDNVEQAIGEEGPKGEETIIAQSNETLHSPTLYHPSKSSSMPFPSRLKKKKKEDDDERLLSIFRQIHVNLPFLEAKVLKDLLSHKDKLEKAVSSIKLSEEYSAVIQRSLPQKEGDPWSFTLPCLIGPLAVKNALDNLGKVSTLCHTLSFYDWAF